MIRYHHHKVINQIKYFITKRNQSGPTLVLIHQLFGLAGSKE